VNDEINEGSPNRYSITEVGLDRIIGKRGSENQAANDKRTNIHTDMMNLIKCIISNYSQVNAIKRSKESENREDLLS